MRSLKDMIAESAQGEGHDAGLERQRWLQAATQHLVARFAELDYAVPAQVRVAVGFCSTGRKGKRIGECWASEASSDQHAEIFLKPTLADTTEIVATLAHELIHATVGNAAKHGPVFKKCAVALGLEGKMTATYAGDAFKQWIAELAGRIGAYPSGHLADLQTGRKTQTTRLLKAACSECGYTVRVTAKWVNDVGPPHCPDHGAMDI